MVELEARILVAPAGLGGPLPFAWLALLDEAERARARGFGLEGDRQRFVASRILLRCGLSAIFAVEPAAFRFRRESSGRWFLDAPALPWVPAISTAHAGDAVAVAIARAAAVGVDVEPQNTEQNATAWTRKEAVVKLHGRGLDEVAEPDPGATIESALIDVRGKLHACAAALAGCARGAPKFRFESWSSPLARG